MAPAYLRTIETYDDLMIPVKTEKRERGSALVAVLILIFTASLLTSAVILIGKTAVFDVKSHVALQRSRYICEGASNRIQWLIAADRGRYGSSSAVLGDSGVYEDLDDDEDRYLPDGVKHILDYYGTKLQFTITDTRSGWNLTGNYTSLLNNMASQIEEDDSEKADQLKDLVQKISDYTTPSDSSDGVHFDTRIAEDDDSGGFTAEEYESAGMAPLPRQEAVVYREELLWIPTFSNLFPPDRYGRLSAVMMPEVAGQDGTPSFFTATPEMLKLFCNLEDDDAETVVKAREEWFTNRTSLSESLDGSLFNTLRNRFLWTPSGYYTVTIESGEIPKAISYRLTFSFEGFSVSGPSGQMVTFLEWLMH